MFERIDRLVSPILVLTAIVIAGSVIHREFFQPPAKQPAPPPLGPPVLVPEWKEALPVGVLIGDSAARVKVVAFDDFECPFCKTFHTVVHDVMKAHPRDVSLTLVHFPVGGHRFATQAARAAECGGTRGKFSEVADLLFAKQDSLGIKAWSSFAVEAGIADTLAFSKCVLDPSPVKRIEAGRDIGEKLNVNATPTVIVNGWRYGRPPNRSELGKAVEALLRGEKLADDKKT